jgi:hypothetical protein
MVTLHADDGWLLKDLDRFVEPVQVCDGRHAQETNLPIH